MNTRLIRYSFLKKCFQIIKIFICFLAVLCLICSCSPEIIPKNTGVKADEKLLEQIKKELEEKKQPILAEEGDVFWTPSGSIWHTTYECGSLARSEVILHGTVEEAKIMGKEKLCTRCEKADMYDPFDDEIEPGDVFWTPSGTIWHTKQECGFLVDSEIILHSTIEEAKTMGKEKLCTRCEKADMYDSFDDEIELGDVFWTEDGGKWHINPMCARLVGAEKVYHSSVEEAIIVGKVGPCSSCSGR